MRSYLANFSINAIDSTIYKAFNNVMSLEVNPDGSFDQKELEGLVMSGCELAIKAGIDTRGRFKRMYDAFCNKGIRPYQESNAPNTIA